MPISTGTRRDRGPAKDFNNHPTTRGDLAGDTEGEERDHTMEFTRLVPTGRPTSHEQWVAGEVPAQGGSEVVEEVSLRNTPLYFLRRKV